MILRTYSTPAKNGRRRPIRTSRATNATTTPLLGQDLALARAWRKLPRSVKNLLTRQMAEELLKKAVPQALLEFAEYERRIAQAYSQAAKIVRDAGNPSNSAQADLDHAP